MVKPPASPGPQPTTLYSSYGVAGQYWAATNLQCSDMTSLIGNNVASMVFDIAKSIDRVTITVYQSAAGEGILSWLTNVVDKLISSLGNAIYFPYLAAVVIIGAIWLAWQGLIRKRGTRTIEGTIWMVVACAAAIWLIGRPADFTGQGTAVSNGISQTLNTAFAKLPAPSQSNCLPVGRRRPAGPARPTSTSRRATGLVAENADELWTVLVCKPWLAGEFGTTAFGTTGSAQTPVNTYGRQLAVGAGHRHQRDADDRPDPGQAGHLLRHRREHPAEGSRGSTRCSRASSGRPGWRSRSPRCSPRRSPASWCC